MRVASWNVNGLRSCATKGFGRWLRSSGVDVACLQEVRALPEQLPRALTKPRGFHAHYAAAERPGYSGCVITHDLQMFSNEEFNQYIAR